MRVLFVSVFIISCYFGVAQEQTYFNNNYPLEWQYSANSMVIIDSTYYLSGNIARTIPECEYNLYGYHITKIQNDGQKDTTIIYDQCGQTSYIGWQGSLGMFTDTLYVVGRIRDNNASKIHLTKYNSSLDTIGYDNYFNDTLVKRAFSLYVKNEMIFICGGVDSSYNEITNPTPDTVFSKALLLKINLDGIIIWSKSYAWGNIADGCWSTLIKTMYSSNKCNYNIGVSHDFSNNAKPIILKTDSLGNEEWVHAYGSNTYSNPRFTDIIETKDSCILVCGAYTYGETYGGLYPYDGWMLKLNPDGSTVWNRKFRDSITSEGAQNDFYAYYKAITEKENGEIIAVVSTMSNLEGEFIGDKFRIRCHYPNGDIKWDKYIDSVGSSVAAFYPNSIALDENENIIVSGYGDFYYYDVNDDWTYDQRIFLIKTDSLGNDHFISVSEPQAKPITRYKLVVYPNPVIDYLFIETHENLQTDYELSIVNQSGQIVYQNHTTKDALSSGICVSNFTPGNYLIQLKTEDKTFFGKFVKY